MYRDTYRFIILFDAMCLHTYTPYLSRMEHDWYVKSGVS